MVRKIKYSARAIEILEALGINYQYARANYLTFIVSKSDLKIIIEIIKGDKNE